MLFPKKLPTSRRGEEGSMVVGPGHIRGVDGVMPIQSQEFGILEGPGSKMQRDEWRMPYTEMENITLATLPSYLNGLVRDATIFLAGTERVAWMVCMHTVVRRVNFAEEPDVGNPQVRLCVQRRLACSTGDSPVGVKARSPVARIAGWRETETLKPIDKVI
jgi:hypothetical protein